LRGFTISYLRSFLIWAVVTEGFLSSGSLSVSDISVTVDHFITWKRGFGFWVSVRTDVHKERRRKWHPYSDRQHRMVVIPQCDSLLVQLEVESTEGVTDQLSYSVESRYS